MPNIGYNRFFIVGSLEHVQAFIEKAKGPRPRFPSPNKEAILFERMRTDGKTTEDIQN